MRKLMVLAATLPALVAAPAAAQLGVGLGGNAGAGVNVGVGVGGKDIESSISRPCLKAAIQASR